MVFSEELYRNRRFSVRRIIYQTKTSQPNVDFTYINCADSVMVVPVFDDNSVALVRQYRVLSGRSELEFPAGGVHEGETFETAARRELLEETGISATKIDRLGEFFPLNGVTDEKCMIFSATGLNFGTPHPDETESDIEVIRMSVDECVQLVLNGGILCAVTALAALLYVSSPVGRTHRLA